MAGREENSDESNDHTHKAYAWQSCDNLHDKKRKTDKRREELLDLMYNSTSNEIEDEGLIREWMALVMERDDILKRTIDKENCETKEFYVHNLKKILNQAPMEVFLPDTEDANLKKLLNELKSQVVNYCKRRDIQSPAPLPPPPPPPPPSIPVEKPATSKPDKEQSNDHSRLNKSKSSHKPLNSVLINEILNTGNRKLRPTGFKHSPGGTPMKRKRRMSLSDQADLLQVALEKKFQNVVASPAKLHSPASFSVSTPTLASREIAPDPGLTTDSFSAIWNDTPSILMGQEDSTNDTPGSTAV